MSFLLCFAPAILLLVILIGRRYPGERLLLAFARARSARRRRTAPAAVSHGRVAEVPRGGLLMAFALAVRPPPLSPALS